MWGTSPDATGQRNNIAIPVTVRRKLLRAMTQLLSFED
jgi:hypothetical protein